MWTDPPSVPTRDETCPRCDAVLVAGDDFCHECGHSLGWREPGQHDAGIEPADAGLERCPACPDGWIRTNDDLHRQCESCGYMERA